MLRQFHEENRSTTVLETSIFHQNTFFIAAKIKKNNNHLKISVLNKLIYKLTQTKLTINLLNKLFITSILYQIAAQHDCSLSRRIREIKSPDEISIRSGHRTLPFATHF